jgi:hypothetical protein
MMTEQEAKAIVAVLYYGRIDWSSEPEFGHLERVAAKCKPRSRVVAWLHDAVEDGLTTFGALKSAGISDVEYSALFLLTRMPEETYLDYIRGIAVAEGEAGEIATEVKLEDNDDNCTRPCPADKQGMRQPGGRYDKARKILRKEKS